MFREEGRLGINSKRWLRIERDGGHLSVAYTLIQGEKGYDDDECLKLTLKAKKTALKA